VKGCSLFLIRGRRGEPKVSLFRGRRPRAGSGGLERGGTLRTLASKWGVDRVGSGKEGKKGCQDRIGGKRALRKRKGASKGPNS